MLYSSVLGFCSAVIKLFIFYSAANFEIGKGLEDLFWDHKGLF